MGYSEARWRLSAEETARLLGLAAHIDHRPGPGGSRCTDPVATKAVFEPVVGSRFPGPWAHAMLVALYPSSQIVGHRDPPIRGIRHHVPLATNPGCWVLHGAIWHQLLEGACYVMDPAEWHGAVNWGTTLRLHLVVDVETIRA